MRIRLARDKDCAALARLRRQTIRHVNAKDYPPDIIKNWAARSGAQRFRDTANSCRRWVALDGDKLIGFCEHEHRGELSRLYVHKDYLRQCVGTRLLQAAELSLMKLGLTRVNLESTITAKEFYLNNGYRIYKKSVSHVDGAPVYKMYKLL